MIIMSCMLSGSILPGTVARAATCPKDTISPCNNYTYWIRKTINGKPYKRLYDFLNKKWLTDWIPA